MGQHKSLPILIMTEATRLREIKCPGYKMYVLVSSTTLVRDIFCSDKHLVSYAREVRGDAHASSCEVSVILGQL
jgi:hypothetical protein